MKTYNLYIESGPQHKKTLLHVLDLLGCNVQGATTDEAIEAAPDTISAYLRFLKRNGEKLDPKAPFKIRVDQHLIVSGSAVGMDSSLTTFDPDLKPVTPGEIETFVARFHALRKELASWAASQSDKELDAVPKSGGRPARKVILHVLLSGYISPLVGTIRGLSAVYTAAERNKTPLSAALLEIDRLIAAGLRASTPTQRRAIIRPSPGRIRTLRKAIRRTLEHDWEHLAELSRRPNGPKL
jgi:predicted RNase H-like HicB family nuclease